VKGSGRVIIFLLLFGVMFSCHKRGSNLPYTEEEHNSMEKVISGIQNIDSLKSKLHQMQMENNAIGEIITYRELGKIYRNNGDFENAIFCHEKGERLAELFSDTIEMIKMLNNLGTNYRRLGTFDMASKYHYQALDLSMKFSDQTSYVARKQYVTSLNGLGNVYLTLGNSQLADSAFRVALKGERALKSPLGQAINYANIGAIFEDQGQKDSAWAYYRIAMKYNQQANSRVGISLCHNHFGQLYENDHQYDKAEEEYLESFKLMTTEKDKWHWLESCICLARIKLLKGQFAASLDYLGKAREVANKIHSKEHLATIYDLFYQVYNKMGYTQAALDNYITSRQYNDSVINLKELTKIQNMRIGVVQGQKQAAEEKLKLEQDSTTLAYILLGVFLVAAILIFGMMWYVLRMKTRSQRMLRQLQDVRESFFTNITHEFRTPLTVIQGFAERLESGEASSKNEIINSGKMIIRQSNGLLSLINQLLDISKIKSAIGTAEWRHGDIVLFITMLVESFQQEAKKKKIKLRYISDEPVIEMDFVPDYLRKVVYNLISNALKFTPSKGSISVYTSISNNHLHLVVADSGIGMKQDVCEHVFDPFFQGESNAANMGTGIGLSLVKQIVDSMKGTILVESKENEGTTFTIDTPLSHGFGKLHLFTPKDYQSRDKSLGNKASLKSDDEASGEKLAGDRLLIIEDNQDIAYYIGNQLKEKYTVFYADNGNEGLEKANEVMPDLIITDIMMPGMDGLELCRRVRESDLLSHIPIIIITAKATEEDRVKGLKAGADAYLTKPFNHEELAVRVQKLLEQYRALREKFSIAMDEGKEEKAQLNPDDRDFLNKVTDMIYALMKSNDVDAESLAARMFMSRIQLNKRIQAITGQNVSAYIQQIRLSYAKRLLDSEVNMSISEISSKCGYDDIAYFSRIFKHATQMSPSQYRRRIK
jgi:two-component system sensor histidine kinase ChiS